MQDIEILKPGLFTTIQDLGRDKVAYYAIPSGGAMDTESLEKANLLVNNPSGFPALECTLIPPQILFHKEIHISLTGADMKWMINGLPTKRYKTLKLQKDDILAGKPSRDGSRAYIGIAGSIITQQHYGSYSSYTYASLGGNYGNKFSKGDFINLSGTSVSLPSIKISASSYTSINSIKFSQGPEWNLLTSTGKKQLQTQSFKLSPSSDRMGARLMDNKIEIHPFEEMKSVPVYPGIIQLPRSGEPIVLLQDGQTTGGYPRIGIIAVEELNRFNQILPNATFNFVLK